MAHDALLANSHVYDPSTGEWISEKFNRVAKILNDLNPEIHLMWIPPAERVGNNLPEYAVAHIQEGHEPYIFMYAREDEVDERLIAAVLESTSDTLIQKLEKMEAAKEMLRLQEEQERLEEFGDRAFSLLRSPKHYYQLGKGKVLHT